MQQLENCPSRRVNRRWARLLAVPEGFERSRSRFFGPSRRCLRSVRIVPRNGLVVQQTRPAAEIQRAQLQNRDAVGALAQLPVHLQGRQPDTHCHCPRCAMPRLRELPLRTSQGLIVDYFCGYFPGQNGPGAGPRSSIWRAPGRTIRNAARPPDDEIASEPPDRHLALLLAAAQLVLFLDLQCPARKPDPDCHAPSRTLFPQGTSSSWEQFIPAKRFRTRRQDGSSCSQLVDAVT